MARKRQKPEEIVAKLRQVAVLTAQGASVAEPVRAIEVTEMTYYDARVAAVSPRLRDTVSRSSPRNSRCTAALLRCRDIRPPRPSVDSDLFCPSMSERHPLGSGLGADPNAVTRTDCYGISVGTRSGPATAAVAGFSSAPWPEFGSPYTAQLGNHRCSCCGADVEFMELISNERYLPQTISFYFHAIVRLQARLVRLTC